MEHVRKLTKNLLKSVRAAVRNKLLSGGGRTCLPKFEFSTKFSIALHVILELAKKIQNLLESDAQNYLNQKFRLGAALHPSS